MGSTLNGVSNGVVKIGFKPFGFSTGSQALAVSTFDDLVAGIRARCLATLTEVTQFPEGLNDSITASQDNLFPFVGLMVGKGQDVSSSWAVFDVAQVVPVDLVYAVITARTGNIDSAQVLRKRLGVLETAFMQDRRLGGLVTQTHVRNVPEAKVNEFEQQFASDGQLITCMVLGLDFTIVQSVLPNV